MSREIADSLQDILENIAIAGEFIARQTDDFPKLEPLISQTLEELRS